MIIKNICFSGIHNKQAEIIENYKGVSIAVLKEDENLFSLHVKDNYYYFLGYCDLERARATIDRTEKENVTIEEQIKNIFEYRMKNIYKNSNSPLIDPTFFRLSLGEAQFLGRVEEYNSAIAYHETQKQKRELEREQKELESRKTAEQKKAEELQKQLELFRQGERIGPAYFLELCAIHGVKIPIKTKGWAKAALHNICVTVENEKFICNYQYFKPHRESTKIQELAIELYKKIA